jgi:glucosamine 6-phosphate synthetase-like amidotransferase/phosphosugar isomerase protein
MHVSIHVPGTIDRLRLPLTVARGCELDKPRNLAKSVTVE